MNTTELVVLEDLLEQAMDSAVIRDRHGGSPIAAGAYLALLNSHRQSFDPDQRILAARFQPEIRDNPLREQLLDIIRTNLRQYIHNDMLQSATIVSGGALEGFTVSDLMRHLIVVAFCRGAQHAARSFFECAEKTTVEMQFITLLDGIRIERDINISEGIRLLPIPNNAADFPPYILTPSSEGYMDYYGRTLVILDQRVSPVFANPSKTSTQDFRSPFGRSDQNTVYPDFIVREFCEALSLSANHIVNYVAWWTHVNPDDAYAVRTSGQVPAYSSLFHTKNPVMEVSSEDIRKALALYSTRKGLRSEVTQKLRVPIDRWLKSKMDSNPVDVFINLGTALESLYLNDTGNAGELRFRMALRAAWHLGDGIAERLSLLDDFKRVYDRRSKAVHTGNLTDNEREPEFMAKAQKLCLKAIVKIIQVGEFPNWSRLVMGG